MCRNMGIIPSHGDVGGKSGSPCSKVVLKTMIEYMNSLDATYAVNATTPVQFINPQPVPVQIYSTEGILVDEEVI